MMFHYIELEKPFYSDYVQSIIKSRKNLPLTFSTEGNNTDSLQSRDSSSPHIAYTSHLSYISHSSSSPHPYSTPHSLEIHSQFRQLSHQTQNHSNLYLSNKTEEKILRSSTKLPRAGEINVEYLRFLDGVNEGWKAGGCRKEDASGVIEVRFFFFSFFSSLH